MEKDANRIVFLDWLRVIACLMVIMVHSTEPFYLGGEGTQILCRENGIWSTLIDSALRACVPLFIMTSSYLLFPLKDSTGHFFRRRFTRVGIPLLVWIILYAVIPLPGSDLGSYSPLLNLRHSVLNFPDSAGHLWFGYMILGVYLIIPILSPWVKTISKKEEQLWLGLWLFTTTLPFLRKLAASWFGLPEVWGECNWNEFGTFYYVSGFAGYVLLGHYIKTHVGELSWKKTLSIAVPLWIVGYAIVAGWFWAAMPKDFPVNEPISLGAHMETSWRFCSTGVALTTIAYFLIAKKFTSDGKFYRKVVVPASKVSYGVYLMHIFVLSAAVPLFQKVFSSMATMAATPLTIVCAAISTFLVCMPLSKLISLIPGGKYIVG